VGKQVIFAQGDDADAVFYIKKNKVKVAVVSKQGKEAVVALLGPDEFVGEGCLIGQPDATNIPPRPRRVASSIVRA
jgi:CRP-like cAMP-binding protein